MQIYLTLNKAVKLPMNLISCGQLLLSGKAKTKLHTTLSNRTEISNIIQVIEGALSAQDQSICIHPCIQQHNSLHMPGLHGWVSAKCIFITGSLWDSLRVVGPESQGGHIPEFTAPMRWPSGTPWSTWEHTKQAWEHRLQAWEELGAPPTCLGLLTIILGAPWITVQQSGENIIFFEKAAGAHGNHSYYLSFNNFYNSFYSVCILIYVSMYLYGYPSTHSISRLAVRGTWEQFEVHLKMMIEWTQRYILRLW